METALSITQQPIPKNHVWTGAEIQELLDATFRYQDATGQRWTFVIQQEDVSRGGHWDIDLHMRAEWMAPDNVTGVPEKQQSRWWRLSKHMRPNEIYSTVLACIEMAERHEMRERIQYLYEGKWTMPYNTHTDINWLADASLHQDLRVDTRPDAPKNQRRE